MTAIQMPDGILIVTPPCLVCGQRSAVTVTDREWAAYAAGALVQVAMPDRDAEFRELVVTGTHPHCWDNVFNAEDQAGVLS